MRAIINNVASFVFFIQKVQAAYFNTRECSDPSFGVGLYGENPALASVYQ